MICYYILQKCNDNLCYYVDLYYKLYKKLHKTYCSRKKIIKLQEIINEALNNIVLILKDIKTIKNCNTFRREEQYELKRKVNILYEDCIYTKKLYHALVDDMVIKYMCKNDCGMFSLLYIKHHENSHYDYNNVKEYLNIIKDKFKNEKGYYIVCDLCSIDLDSGDLLYCKNKRSEMDYVELKDINSIEGKKILNAVLGNEDENNLNEKEKIQYHRMKNQLDKHTIIDNNLVSHPICYGRYPYNMVKPKTFNKIIKKDLFSIKRKRYIETKVDDYISYLIVNDGMSSIDNKIENELLLLLRTYSTNGQNVFSYEEFILDSNVYRPYMLNWNMNDYKKIITQEYKIFFKIDLIKIISGLKLKGVKIYSTKETDETKKNPGILVCKGKNFCFDVLGESFLLGTMILYRIPTCLYTGNDTINFFMKVYEDNVNVINNILKNDFNKE